MAIYRNAPIPLLMTYVVPSIASPSSYLCTIDHVYGLSREGALERSPWEQTMKGGTFSLSRETGAIEGATLTTRLAGSTTVIEAGSEVYSFKAVAYFERQVQVIEVQEFRKGAVKPFVATSMGGAGIVTGTCQ